MRIIGVDFSGAGADTHVGKTWIAEGLLEGNTLILANPNRISRDGLTKKLAGLDKPAVAAMDFPFSVPEVFARCWQKRPDILAEGATMPDLWAASAILKWTNFKGLQDELRIVEFVKQQGEPKRACDPPESYSPLHYANPNMVPMTFRGMQMLNRLWQGPTADPVIVPPLPQPSRHGKIDTITLLEVMPGAVLRRFGLPHTGYKDNSRRLGQREDRKKTRRHILDELPQRINPLTTNLPGVYAQCLENDDALDSVIAAITAALWVIDRKRFIIPPAPGQPNYNQSLLEGWLYIPRRRCPNPNCEEPLLN